VIWKRLIATLEKDAASRKSGVLKQADKARDWATEALNSPAGSLAQALLNDPNLKSPNPGSKLSLWWVARATELLDLAEDAFLHAITLFSHHLAWFYQVDPQWTDSRLVSAIAEGGNKASAFWAGFFWGARRPQQELYLKLKPAMLNLAVDETPERREHTEQLAGMLLAGWGTTIGDAGERVITDSEMRAVLLGADDDFRGQIIWYLEMWPKEEGANHWADDALVFLRNVWPRQLVARTSRVSSRLCGLAFSQHERFPQYVDAILPLVTKIEQDYVNLHIAGRSETKWIEQFPEKTLTLLSAVLPDDPRRWPYGINDILNRVEGLDAALKKDPRLIELMRIWNAR
jgi:hypothetical protein